MQSLVNQSQSISQGLELIAGNVLAGLAADLLLVILLGVLPLSISARVGEHPDLETLGELLALAADKRSLDAGLDVAERAKVGRFLVTRLLPFSLTRKCHSQWCCLCRDSSF